MDLAHQIRDTIGALYKVLPTAIVAAAMRPSTTRRELEGRADAIIDPPRPSKANLAGDNGRDAVEAGAPEVGGRHNNYLRPGRAGRRPRAPPARPLHPHRRAP